MNAKVYATVTEEIMDSDEGHLVANWSFMVLQAALELVAEAGDELYLVKREEFRKSVTDRVEYNLLGT